MAEQQYELSISEKQARVILASLDLFSRIGIGQLREVLRHPQYQLKMIDDNETYTYCQRLLDQVKKLLTGHGPHSSYGVCHPEVHEDSNIAYDLLQVIRHRLSWDRIPDGGPEINFDPPIQFSEEELAEILTTRFYKRNPTLLGVDLNV